MRLLQVLVAIPVALTTIALVAASAFWPGDLALFFLPWLALGAYAVFALSWVVGARVVAGTSALLLLVTTTMLIDGWMPPPETRQDGLALSLMTFNSYIANDDPAALAQYLRAAMPDIVVLQEMVGPQKAATVSSLSDLYPYTADTGGDVDLVLLSRYPVIDIGMQRADAGRGIDGSLLRAEIDIAGTALTVYALHAPTPRFGVDIWRRRNDLLASVAAAIAAEPDSALVVLAGDFNTPPWSPFFREMIETAELTETSGRLVPVATRLVDRDGLPVGFGAPVDHVLVSDRIGWRPIEAGPQLGSDHRAMTVELVLPRSSDGPAG